MEYEKKNVKVKENICTFSKSEPQLAEGRVRAVGRPERDRTMNLTLRLLMSYIYIYIYIYMEQPFLMFLDHTQRRTIFGRTTLDE